jgi:hypothetical protein
VVQVALRIATAKADRNPGVIAASGLLMRSPSSAISRSIVASTGGLGTWTKPESRGGERDGMGYGESRGGERLANRTDQEHQAWHEQQMIGAGQDVLDATRMCKDL